jgi:IQ domain-containing protein H
VEVVYVSPFQMTNDVTGYYMKILEIGEIENAQSKLNIVVPDNL